MDTGYFESHLKCSLEDKKSCMGIVNEMLRLQDMARKHGIMELEKEIIHRDDLNSEPLLVKGIALITDGIEPVYVEKVLKNYIILDGYIGVKFLKSMIIMEGVLGIQQGFHPRLCKELLKSYFGMDFSETFEEKCILQDEKMVSADIFHDKVSYSEQTELLERYLNVDARGIQRLLRELDIIILSKALYGASGKTITYFMQNVSDRTSNYIMSITISQNNLFHLAGM